MSEGDEDHGSNAPLPNEVRGWVGEQKRQFLALQVPRTPSMHRSRSERGPKMVNAG